MTDDPSTPGSQVITVTAVLAAPRVTVSVTGPVDLIGPNRCRSSTDLRWVVSWQVTAATSATLVLPDRRLAVDPAGGSTTVCLAPGGVAEVTADGPGGTASASDTADLAPAG